MKRKKKKSVLREWLEALFIGLLLVMFIRVFIIDLIAIPGSSMEKTLLSGDFILVNKMSYGVRTPITPLSFPFSHQNLPFSTEKKGYTDAIELPYYRFPEIKSINRNDVIVFNYPLETSFPVDKRSYYIKRCIGLPGDTVQVYNKEVLVNTQYIDEPPSAQFDFHLKMEDALPEELLEKFQITEGGKVSNMGDWQFSMTRTAAGELKKYPGVHSMIPIKDRENLYLDYIFPYTRNYPWNRDYYGPVYVPKAGDSVKITTKNLPLYERIISEYEANSLNVENAEIIINGKPSEYYKFKLNYYFMLGDNRHNSADSRFWGFVPEDHIAGKVTVVLFSIDKNSTGINKIRWNRIFKPI